MELGPNLHKFLRKQEGPDHFLNQHVMEQRLQKGGGLPHEFTPRCGQHHSWGCRF